MFSIEIYKYFAAIVYNKTGIFYPEKDFYRLDSRLNKLMSNFGCNKPEDLYKLYQTKMTPEMETLLIDLCTNNETYFFRDNKPFNALINNLIPHILEENPSRVIDIWSCASSTGQEPLSIIMSLLENCSKITEHQISLTATDISTQALRKSKSGEYTNLEVQRGLPINLLMKYFEKQNDGSWKAKSQLLNRIQYSYFNLLKDRYPINKYDIIFCRNVLIYQDKENKDLIVNNLYSSLRPGGYLLMGAGESMIGSTVDFIQETHSNMMVFKKPEQIKSAA